MTNKYSKNVLKEMPGSMRVYMYVVMTGHDSLNAFLYDRNLSESARCACGAESKNWKHILVECCMYEDLRALSGARMHSDGSVNVERVLECK